MKPCKWRPGAGLGGMGACAIAPSITARSRIGTPRDLRDRAWRDSSQPMLSRRGLRRLALPRDHSLLIASGDYPAAHEVLRGLLRDARGPLLVIDMDGAMHASTAGWRTGPVRRLSPFGGDHPWNPLAYAWTPERLRRDRITELAALWYPGRGETERAIATHVRNLFIALTGAVDDVLRHTNTVAPPAPGDLWRLAIDSDDTRTFRERLCTVAAADGVRSVYANVLAACARLDDVSLTRVLRRLKEPLELLEHEACDTGTRGLRAFATGTGSTYLHVPYARRKQATPLIEAVVTQWVASARDHAGATLAVHALDLFPALPSLTAASGIRCIATVRNLENLLLAYDRKAHDLARRFDLVALHAPDTTRQASRDAGAIAQCAKAHGNPEAELATRDLVALRAGEQMLIGPTLPRPIRCRIARPRNHAPHPMADVQGEVTPFPPPLAALAASVRRR